ncbi:glutathione hydrolase 6 isoform 1 [Mus musculus]|uniref:Glutathione hydrolase 6 n=1 Tax=Mus musculus TaxID=10090 RepID=GGT6_MOUSE|nr:glutathione hydrolase 6 isoform 1 [Mus musculus]Q6PDE7.1 RecName: Full=Glutathione hydrolase 6; AltName: Full=Gamma-glutamyltransferase 6; Short=GGT 6; AltName: Full=Gamma-glutamyltranspeptidase 6; Contains: RecName: Full=Glutathione hydrolase 6 heavy chain; Contains: RecName: Full=Glutathione hydrolase 6 light chain; Flags: Precursor [Mus musculus]AAH58747.1 Gamma-glutamyltransferase 6 [Mus musculus]EDL12680.1 gamma-glutamyltransferase 6, isoform CRA_b [Mus musculus]|eukprot:NP_082095.2 glutathione hydrolase 6 [Mus musculus]
MDATTGPVHYHKLQLWEPGVESEEEEEEEEEEIAEPLVLSLRRLQNTPRNEVGGLPGAWARLLAGLLLLAVSSSLALRQLHSRDSPRGNLGSVAPPASRHSHRPGVYHHSAIISPAATCSQLGQELLVAGGNVVDAGVGAALCLAVVHPHATGLGATFWGLFYNSSSGNSTALTAGPTQLLAPGLGLPTGLPALHLLHAHFGRLPWPHLLTKPAMLAEKGFEVDAPLANALAIQGTKGLCPLFCHTNGTPLGLGARATNPNLAAVLRSAALASSPDLAGKALLNPLVRDLGLELPSAQPVPSLEPALQLLLPRGVLFTTPGPSAGPELVELLESTLHSRTPSSAPCPPFLQTAETPVSSALATVDSNGSMLLLISSINSSFGSGHLSPSTGVLLSNLEASPAPSAWACPLILRDNLDDTEADMLGMVASGISRGAKAMTCTLLNHLATPQIPQQPQHQRPTESPGICGQGALLQAVVHAEHAHVSSVPSGCCPFQGY